MSKDNGKNREEDYRNPTPQMRGLDAERRRIEVAKLYSQYKTQQEIAEILGVSQATISLDIREIKRAYREQSVAEFEDRLSEEMVRLSHIEDEALRAWEMSSTVLGPVKGLKGLHPLRRREGNAEYLKLAKDCITTRLKIMGALKPKEGDKITVNIFDLITQAVQTVSDPREVARNVIAIQQHIHDPVEDRIRREIELLESIEDKEGKGTSETRSEDIEEMNNEQFE